MILFGLLTLPTRWLFIFPVYVEEKDSSEENDEDNGGGHGEEEEEEEEEGNGDSEENFQYVRKRRSVTEEAESEKLVFKLTKEDTTNKAGATTIKEGELGGYTNFLIKMDLKDKVWLLF